MGKTLVVNMNYLQLEGDILDISQENAGVIYSISKDALEELSVDYVDESNKNILKERKYDACTFFFTINQIWGSRKRATLVKEVTSYVKEDGRIFLWDVNKELGNRVDNKVEIILPSGEVKSGLLKNNNPISSCSFEEIIKILEKYYIIEDTKVWKEMFFIQGRRKK